GLVRTGKLRAQKERKQKKNTKKNVSSESEWESESETDTKGYVPDESVEDSNFEETRSEELVQRNSRPEPNPAQEEMRSKKIMSRIMQPNDSLGKSSSNYSLWIKVLFNKAKSGSVFQVATE
ncbi:hypothetical protein PIB30_077276, partial [Stylosanthes scabra]|nr:hypothetical protein [Stylosanthes scabra]